MIAFAISRNIYSRNENFITYKFDDSSKNKFFTVSIMYLSMSIY